MNKQKEENEASTRRNTNSYQKEEGYRKTEMFLVAHELHIVLKHN